MRQPSQMPPFLRRPMGFAALFGTLFYLGLFALFAFDAAAEDATESAKKYPPYPDIWGRELPVPENFHTGFNSYPRENGDVWFEFTRRGERRPPGDGKKTWNFEWFLLKFFENGLTPIPNEKVDDVFRKLFKKKMAAKEKREKKSDEERGGRDRTYEEFERDLGRGIIFEGGGSVMQSNLGYVGELCWANNNYHIISKDAQGKVVADKMLFYLFEKPRWRNLKFNCRLSGNDEYFDFRIEARQLSLIPLADESFLAVGGRFVIRFDRDLHSPFVAARPRLFLVDTAKIKAIIDRVGGVNPELHHVNDAILSFLLELKKKKMKKAKER